jgi:hypothetical protein
MSTMTEDPVLGPSDSGDDRGASYAGCSTADLASTVAELAKLHAVVHAELLGVLGELGTRAQVPGECRDTVEWVETRLGTLRSTAREWTKVAGALRDLPVLAGLYGSGSLSWDQVRHAVRFVTPGTDAVVSEEVAAWSAEQVAQLAREHTARSRDDDAEADRGTRLRLRRDHKRRGTHVTAFLPDGDDEPLRVALERRAQQIGPDPITGIWDPAERRMGQALAMLGAADLATDQDLDRALAVIHIDHDILSGEADGNATTDSGGVISAEVARRMCCDGWIQYVAEDGTDNDRPVGVGRKTRVVPRWLRRLIRQRDRRCRCCGGPIHHIHHIVFWGNLGRTDEDSLAGLCWGCHHRVHEGGWTITGDPNGALVFTNPYGETVTSVRQPVARDLRRRAARAAGVRLGNEAPGPRARPHGPARTKPGTTHDHGGGTDPPPVP